MSSKDVDRLSRLPEPIVSHILSLMPTKFAVRTTILAKRFQYSWMFVTNLDFDDDDSTNATDIFSRLALLLTESRHNSDSFIKFVDRVLESCRSPQVNLVRIHVYYKVRESCPSKWIDKAVRLNVRELDLRLSLSHLPLSLRTCKTLTKLVFHRTGRDRQASKCWECPERVSLPCLKTLDIDVCDDPHENAFRVISGCPLLENLSLEVYRVWGEYERQDDYIFNIPTLKRLKLMLGYDLVNHKVVLNVPKLEYFVLCGELFSLFVMEDVSSLAEVTLSIERLDSDHHLWDELFKGLSGVKSLSAQNENSRGCFGFISPLPVFQNMKHLELNRFWNPEFIPLVLERSPQLTCLCVKHVHDYSKHEESDWIEPKVVPSCMLTNLTTIKFKCVGQKCVIQLMEYMLRNAEVLKTVTITWRNLCFQEETRLAAKLLKVPRASRDCEISFIGAKLLE
ncbi:putative FBD domain, leucine-rich repeat domain superfamily [Helianthus annuus]|nr:putative FBD domain, leucine-rich repeat domain superfamily [Helianthus annuus]KAJ0828077.1 putative FBD domain, leucine-rich repeat domain superfamily [Helianthus annuus]